MFPLALQEQKQLWNSLKRQLLSEKVMYTILILKWGPTLETHTPHKTMETHFLGQPFT